MCSICKKTGHLEDRCWERDGIKGGKGDKKEVKGEKPKDKKRKRPHFRKGVKVVNRADTETDADSSAPSDSEVEVEEEPERTRSRKIGRKTVIKTPI